MYKKLNSLFLVAIFLFALPAIAEENITTGTIDVYSSSPLPSIGLPKSMVPANIQTVKASELGKQSGATIADYMVNNLQGVTVNEVGGNPFQLINPLVILFYGT